jgi:hypothetical protein
MMFDEIMNTAARARRGRWLALAGILLVSSTTQPRAASEPLVLRGVTVVDVGRFGNSHRDLEKATIVIRDGRVAAVGEGRSVAVPSGSHVLELPGKYVVPGLIDAYATQNNQGQANAWLYMGVTSIVALDDPGGRRGPLFRDAHPSPRLFELENADPRPDERDAAGKSPATQREIESHLDALKLRGIRVVQIDFGFSPEQVRWTVERARRLGLATIGALALTGYEEATALGVQAFVHASRYALDLSSPDLHRAVAAEPFGLSRIRFYQWLSGLSPDAPVVASYARSIGRSHVGLIPTLAIYYLDLPDHKNPWESPVAAILDPKDIHLPADPATGQRPPEPDIPAEFAPNLLRIERRYVRAGARYLSGSGSDAFGTLPGESLHTELDLLVRIGLTPRQALAAATANYGEIWGWKDVGRITPGAFADILVLDRNPAEDVAALRDIHTLIVGGRVMDRAQLLKK